MTRLILHCELWSYWIIDWLDDSLGPFWDLRKSMLTWKQRNLSGVFFVDIPIILHWESTRDMWTLPRPLKLSIQNPVPIPFRKKFEPFDQFLSTGQSAHSNRVLPLLLCLLWLDPCCLDTVHTAVRLGHSQASEESGVNGIRKWLVIFLSNWAVFYFFN